MPYSIQLRFDAASEQRLLEFSRSLRAIGLVDPQLSHGSVPHVALAVFRDADPDLLIAAAQALPVAPFALSFPSLGTFGTPENVIFLEPSPCAPLGQVHRELYDRLGPLVPYDRYYQPGVWVPHCTVGIDFAEEQFVRAFEHLRRAFRAETCRVESIAVTRFRPSEVLFRREIEPV